MLKMEKNLIEILDLMKEILEKQSKIITELSGKVEDLHKRVLFLECKINTDVTSSDG